MFQLHLNFIYTTNLYPSGLPTATCENIKATGIRKVGLKGHCHAIWQFYKKLEGVFASMEFQN